MSSEGYDSSRDNLFVQVFADSSSVKKFLGYLVTEKLEFLQNRRAASFDSQIRNLSTVVLPALKRTLKNT